MIFLQQYTTTDHCPFNVFCTSEKTLSSIFSNRTLTGNRRAPQMPSLLQDKQSQSLLCSQLCHILQPLLPPGSCPLDWLHFVSLYYWEEAKPGIVLSTHALERREQSLPSTQQLHPGQHSLLHDQLWLPQDHAATSPDPSAQAPVLLYIQIYSLPTRSFH